MIVKKSEDLLSREGAIIPAPGNDKVYMVESQTSSKATLCGNQEKWEGHLRQVRCPFFAAAKLCPHSVAASEKAGALEKFVSWFVKNGPTSMNLTAFITYDSSKDTGKKLSKSSIVHRQFNRNGTSASQHSSPEPPVPQPPRKVHSHLILSHNFQCPIITCATTSHSRAAIVAQCAATALVPQRNIGLQHHKRHNTCLFDKLFQQLWQQLSQAYKTDYFLSHQMGYLNFTCCRIVHKQFEFASAVYRDSSLTIVFSPAP